MEEKDRSVKSSLEVRRRSAGAGVSLCFKVPFQFRHWFKQQALSRELTMTEFLVLAVESYTNEDLDPSSISSIVEQSALGGNRPVAVTGSSPAERKPMEDSCSHTLAQESPHRPRQT
jgi:hypothetical protein